MRKVRISLAMVGAVALTFGMVACGDKEDSSSTPTAATEVESALAEKVPAAIKADGKIVIGTDSTYAPNEFLDADGKTVKGFDVDLFNAVAAKLGLKTEWVTAPFDSIITGVDSGKYELGVSSFTINDERKAQANMVSYFQAGTLWAQKKGGTVNPDDACGKRIAVQTATVQVEDVTARSKKCTDAGKPAITIDQYQSQADATAAVVSGKNDAMLADSPVIAYAVKQTNGQLETLGNIYDSAPYGYVIKKDQTAFAEAIAEALKALIADGTYTKVLEPWGVEGGALKSAPAVNP